MKMLRQVLENKEKEINDAKDRLRQVKEDATREYHDSDTYLTELEGIYADGFDDCLRQVKASFQTWTCRMYQLTLRSRPQFSPSTSRARINYSLMMPSLMTLVVIERLLQLKAKSNPLRTVPINVMRFKL